MDSLSGDLDFRGLVYQETAGELRGLLDRGSLTAYIGFDPTADSLHVGHLVQLCNLRRLQLVGNRPIVVAGGATGMVGDPGGKSEERVLLGSDQIEANLAGILPQLEKLLDFSPGSAGAQAMLLDNREWLGSMGLLPFLRDVGKHFTINQMVAKDSVKSRIDRAEQGISFTEFSYMLLQAYDYLYLHDTHGCRLQMGASDQWGNITMGVELIRKIRGATVHALTTPLVTKPDGTKLGKSESGTVWLDPAKTSPYALFQYFVRTEDAVVGRYLRMLTFLDREEILALDDATAQQPQSRQAQRALAREMTRLVHGEAEAIRVEDAAAALFSEEIADLDEQTLLMVVGEAPATTMARSALSGEGLDVAALLAETGLSPSRGAARTAIAQGGAYVNNRRVASDGARVTEDDLLSGRYVLVRRGRRDFHLLQFE